MVKTEKYIQGLEKNFIRINEIQKKAILEYWGKYIDDYELTSQDVWEQTRKIINKYNYSDIDKFLIDYKAIGRKIKQKRVEQDMTQQEMAKVLKVSIAYISRLERGQTQVNLKRLLQISIILGVPAGYFLDETVEEQENYLKTEFDVMLQKCTTEQKKFIYKIIELIIKDNK